MTWWTAEDGPETVFRCVNILTGEIVNLKEVDRGDQSAADGIRSTQPRGQTDDSLRARPGAQSH